MKLNTFYGTIELPVFMPCATRGFLKYIPAWDFFDLGFKIILCNTFHLMISPGINLIKKAGGISKFIGFKGPVLTDSGGFQIFSLNKNQKIEKLIDKELKGIKIKNPQDGKTILLTPEKIIQAQLDLESSIIMPLDICMPYPSKYETVKKAVEITNLWEKNAYSYFISKISKTSNSRPLIFGIIQGGIYKKLRKKSIEFLLNFDFDGYAIGGLAVGEPTKKLFEIVEYCLKFLPKNKPIYLMGVGKPSQIKKFVKMGISMFDCVIPTREARHGRLYILNKKGVHIIKIANTKYKSDFSPIDKNCNCKVCRNYTRAYLRYLYLKKEPLYYYLSTYHNLFCFNKFI